MQLQIIGWMFLVSVIILRFGMFEQQNFYSNDQRYHVRLIEGIFSVGLPLDLDWWLSAGRVPYVLPASVVAAVGIHPLLALKTVSLLALLVVTALVRRLIPATTLSQTLAVTYFTATASIGIFFSALGLRDTSMMLFVLWFFVGSSTVAKLSALLCVVLLRPHLAAALGTGALVALVYGMLHRKSKHTPLSNTFSITFAPFLGYHIYSLGLQFQDGPSGEYGHRWGILPVIRIASNYVGLQFLTVRESTVEFSITSLLLLRLFLSETIIIPLLFTIVVILTRRHSLLMQSVMWSFGIYVGIVTNTDFNSFRQNIPFMPVMGLVVLLAWKEHRQTRSEVQDPSLTARRET